MRDGRSWQTVKEQRPDLELVTLREVGIALQYWHKNRMVKSVKRKLSRCRFYTTNKSLDDEIPF